MIVSRYLHLQEQIRADVRPTDPVIYEVTLVSVPMQTNDAPERRKLGTVTRYHATSRRWRYSTGPPANVGGQGIFTRREALVRLLAAADTDLTENDIARIAGEVANSQPRHR